jgi:hypothetical protein
LPDLPIDLITQRHARCGSAVPKQLPPPEIARGMQHIAAREVQGGG